MLQNSTNNLARKAVSAGLALTMGLAPIAGAAGALAATPIEAMAADYRFVKDGLEFCNADITYDRTKFTLENADVQVSGAWGYRTDPLTYADGTSRYDGDGGSIFIEYNPSEVPSRGIGEWNVPGEAVITFHEAAIADGSNERLDVRITYSDCLLKNTAPNSYPTNRIYLAVFDRDFTSPAPIIQHDSHILAANDAQLIKPSGNSFIVNETLQRYPEAEQTPNTFRKAHSGLPAEEDLLLSPCQFTITVEVIGAEGLTSVLRAHDIDGSAWWGSSPSESRGLVWTWESKYSESVEPLSGFHQDIHVSEDSKLGLVDTLIRRTDNADDAPTFDFMDPAEVGSTSFTALVDAKKHSFTIRQMAGSSFGYLYEFHGSVTAAAGQGGTVGNPGFTEYDAGEDAVYTYSPSEGYRVKNLLVDGKDVDANSAGGAYTFVSVVKNHEIAVEFEPIAYKVLFDGNSPAAIGIMDPQEMVYDEAESLDTVAFSLMGHDFAGWNTEADGTGTSFTDAQEVLNLTAEDGTEVTLYAQWKKAAIKVTYIDGLTGEPIKTDEIEWGDGSEAPEFPAHTGYKPVEWDGAEEAYTEDTEVTAIYQPIAYKVLFDKNADDADGEMGPQDMEYDEAENIDALAFARPGYDFAGWNTAADGTGDRYTDAQEVLNLTAEDGGEVTLYAQWTPREDTAYKVEHVKANTGEAFSTEDKTGTTGQITAAEATTLTGYTVQPFEQAEIAGDGSTVVTIPYAPNAYKIAFDANDGAYPDAPPASGVMGDQDMEYDQAEQLDACAFTREGHSFAGWKDDGGVPYADLAEVVNLTAEDGGKITLHAQWERIPVRVTYIDRLTGDIVKTDDLKWGDPSDAPAVPTHTGYKTSGWEKDGIGRVTEDATIAVAFEPISYKIRFDGGADDAKGSMEPQPMTYDVSDKLFRNAFSRTGYKFAGWLDENGYYYQDAQEVLNLIARDGGEVTLYAQWEALPAPAETGQEVPAASTPAASSSSVPATGSSAPTVADLSQTGTGMAAAALGAGGIIAALAAAFRRKK